MNRSAITDPQKAKEAILEIVAAALEDTEQVKKPGKPPVGQAATALTAAEADALSLLQCISRHPGKSRRYFQQLSHWGAKRFNRVIFRLERQGLVQWDDRPTTGGRRRRTYCASNKSEHPADSPDLA